MTIIDFSKMKTYQDMIVEDNKTKITKLLDNFEKNGKTLNILDLYDMAYQLNYKDLREYEDLDNRFDDLFEKYAKEISKYFMKVFDLVAVRDFFVERVDIIIPYLSFDDLGYLRTKIQEVIYHHEMNKTKTIHPNEYYIEMIDICKEQLQEIEIAEKNIIKLGVKMIKPLLINNDEILIKEIFDYL